MKTLKLILASLLISFGVNAQKVNTQTLNAKKIERKDLTPEQKAKMQTEKMKTELNLTNEQYDRAYQINLGIIQKNKSLQEQKMTTEERKSAVKMNNEARMAMLKDVLTAEQYTKMQEKIKEAKATENK